MSKKDVAQAIAQLQDIQEIGFNEFLTKFNEYRWSFFIRGFLIKFKTVLVALDNRSPLQERLLHLTVQYNLVEFEKLLTHIMENIEEADFPYHYEQHASFINVLREYFWKAFNYKAASILGAFPIACLSKGLPDFNKFGDAPLNVTFQKTFVMNLALPYEAFENQLKVFDEDARGIYEENKFSNKLFRLDIIKDSLGRDINKRIFEYWRSCLEAYDLSHSAEYIHKNKGTVNYTKIGKAVVTVTKFTKPPHFVNRAKKYIADAERLMQAAVDMQFP